MIHEVTDENFEREVADSDVPCLIEFTGAWCSLCEKLLPTLEELAGRYDGRVKFCTVNTDDQRDLRIKFAVAALPYLVYVANGQMTPLFDEYVTLERLQERLDYMLAGNQAPTTRPL